MPAKPAKPFYFAVEEDKPPNPFTAGLLDTDGIVFEPYDLAGLVQHDV
jgi:hypothetical protein